MDFGGFLGNSTIKARLTAAFDRGKVSHSYLLCGPSGSGRHTLARQLAAAMQCTGSGRLPCGVCPACRKVLAGTHPDVIFVDDPEHKLISVDVIRRMRADVFIRPNEGKRKIYILQQDMNESAQNALLKILEEPPAYAVFLLLADTEEKLLTTIRSRCSKLTLAPLSEPEMAEFLRQKHPECSADALRAAWQRSGGYAGPALALLESEVFSPQALRLAEAYAARDTFGLLETLVPLEKAKREALIPVLTQLREILVQALAARAGQDALLPQSSAILKSRTGAQILSAVQDLQHAVDDLNANVGVGAVIGWLTIRLR